MARRATHVDLEDRFHIMAGEPILDTTEGVLIVAFDDGTNRTFNWDKVVSFYQMTEEETLRHFREEQQ
ncbi:hypothetical protein REDROCK_50 [Mycobacterium phage RedRock]|uniref:Uncharacterized protein n=1 Tax=Mycobacterium phage RedRock TaxID=711470 RepID=D3JZB2_9CAUD|nr:hypothetical protein O153_gp57 [Mycobacterium phage AnnaL29]YP_009101303.1 hypothetical protein REDROCK_50 [Mycobacterium phage RedRock]ADB93743.1 hypothetical protein REDROCK_50 [Mycobacterium phage RedRock]AGS82731.1 hypothetical protein ANNAL29_50 [Mycobacterium phage AnnaL29]